MKNKGSRDVRAVAGVQHVNPEPETLKTYGDFKRLDAYPWIDNRAVREDSIPHKSVLEHWDDFDGQQGHVTRHWRVTGNPEVGLPQPSDQKLYLELLFKTMSSRPTERKVEFTFRELAACLSLEPSFDAYQRVKIALLRVSGVRVDFVGTVMTANEKQDRVVSTFGVGGDLVMVTEHNETTGGLYWGCGMYSSLKFLVDSHPGTTQDDTLRALLTSILRFRPIIHLSLNNTG